MNKIILPLVIGLLVGGGLGFYGGTSYQKGQVPAGRDFAAARFGGVAGAPAAGGGFQRPGGGAGVGRTGGGFNGGEILAIGDDSLTVKLADGGSRIIYFSDSTEVMKTTSGAVSDLAVGDQVTAMGTPNDDGSVTATSIQLRPEGLVMPPDAGRGDNGAATSSGDDSMSQAE
ncbi:hypothetical protein COY93_02575 [Candidatus Uhrbacteria bacterium CG_4_10_14_0_8_um_filter_58_22]|uniref:DUF5666 domain-containing protein n=1 Tax=Candidatus Uhrbacteria bacterium CG_4_10_14_0_8_um_filter_58_22 TaxID=1975029 RepID=A0A2M7QB02_9BACT|nr:MAG: hypothetical protein COY93_02575 [Candidatus Uhrbacteria bacterium CG_4_10_14_0_8_um_filter_58_22]